MSRVLLKLSGESFANPDTNFGIQPDIIERIALEITHANKELIMQKISDFIPLTSQLNSARHILINNSLDNYISSNLFYLHILFSLFFLFCSMLVFKIVVSLVKIRGTLGTY